MSARPTVEDIRDAQERLHGVARVITPVYSSETLSGSRGGLSCSRANLQRTGAFKIRGAYNTVAQLSADERGRGVLTASAGNHVQAVAWAAAGGDLGDDLRSRGRPDGEGRRCARYGAQVGPLRARDSTRRLRSHWPTRRRRGRRSSTPSTTSGSSGQGTLGLELAGQLPSGDATVVIPVGGGGLAAVPRSRSTPCARGQARRRPVRRVRAVRRPRASRCDDRRRDRRQRPGGDHAPPSSTTCSTTSSWSTTRSRRRSSCCSSGRSSSWKAQEPRLAAILANRAGGKGRCAPSSPAATSTRRR